MTIKGFPNFLKSRPDLYQSIELSKTIVVFDGHVIQRQLNELSQSSIKSKFCDYTAYEQTITSFLRRLKICGIVPIIFFDGSINTYRYRRCLTERIKEINEIHKMDYRCRYQSPSLRNYVFSSVVRSFGVEIIQTCSNTWSQVAALANKLMCPVYSQRRQFYYLSLQFGLLDDQSIIKSHLHYNCDQKQWSLSVNILHINSLSKVFTGIKAEVMPLLGVIFEDDFIDQNIKKEIKEWHKSNRIEVILNWIKGKSLKTCLNSMIPYIKSSAFKEREDKSETLNEMIRNFKSNENDSMIRRHLSDSVIDSESLKMLAKGDNEIVLPNWFINEYQKGIIRPALMNVVKKKTHVLYPQIEDYSQHSSYDCTLRLRRFLYGILRTEVENPPDIHVLDRTKLTQFEDIFFKESSVPPLLRICQSQELPYLANIRHLEINERRKLFLSIMKSNESFVNRCRISLLLSEFFEDIPSVESCTFLIIVIRYLIQNKPNFNWNPSISSLVLSIMFYSNKELGLDLKWSHLNKIASEERFKPEFIHFFSQLQACIHISNFINTVMGTPLNEGKPYFCLNGIFFYNAMKNLSTDEEYESFLKYLFRSHPSKSDIFIEIKELIEWEFNY